MTDRVDDATLRAIIKASEAATPGPWHHVQAFESVPAVRTIHGKVPGQRVDYVSTWPGPGTPKGHRVVVPMETVAEGHIVRTVSSPDMAYITLACNNAAAMVRELAEARKLVKAYESALDPNETKHAYMGEVKNDNGSFVSWTTTKEIMAMIHARALQHKGPSDV